jgi:transposase InsO family protein
MIWHRNLHDFHHGGWIIAWIDDRSRMCLGFKSLANKDSFETANAFCEVLSEQSVPYSIRTDNGKEFERSFQKVLVEPLICHIYSAPYNLQQNGKCERFRARH